jgi:hypothetical protein
MTSNRCQFEIVLDGKLLKCTNNQGGGICRTKSLCRTHYSFLKRDNLRRANKEIDIPLSFESIIKVSPLVKRLCKEEVKTPISFIDNADYEFDKDEEIIVEFVDEKNVGY